MTDTIFADVSYFQAPVNDSYPYRVLSIRSNDGTFRDTNFYHNYQWCVNACNSGRLAFFIVYFYWRTGPGDVDTHINMVTRAGGPHPKMVTMIDLESGGNPAGDWSGELNGEYVRLAGWLGNAARVIAYANAGDYGMWRSHPAALRWVGAGYGRDPHLPNQIAHQYTDGAGFGGGLPEGAPPFGNCDMNSANGLDPYQFAAACGIGSQTEDDMTGEEHDKLFQVWGALFNPVTSKSKYRAEGEGPLYAVKDQVGNIDAMSHEALVERNALLGNAQALALVKREADKGDKWSQVVYDKCLK